MYRSKVEQKKNTQREIFQRPAILYTVSNGSQHACKEGVMEELYWAFCFIYFLHTIILMQEKFSLLLVYLISVEITIMCDISHGLLK